MRWVLIGFLTFGSRSTTVPSFILVSQCAQLSRICPSLLGLRASGQMVRALACCAKHRWFEPNPRIIVGMLAHCPSSSKWVPGGNTGEAKGGEERNWPPYLTMPAAQVSVPLTGSPQRTESYMGFTFTFIRTSLVFLLYIQYIILNIRSLTGVFLSDRMLLFGDDLRMLR